MLTGFRYESSNGELQRAHVGDAAFDLPAAEGALVLAGQRVLIPTGIRLALPPGTCGLVLPRSGLAINYGITVLNAPGLIDSGYRGEVKVPLINLGHEAYVVTEGDRIAQLLIVSINDVIPFRTVALDDLGETVRGSNGFGSSGR